MIINHNLNAMNAHRNMSINTSNSGKSMEKLSSGVRINRAGDDAAGLAISEKMRGQIRGLDQASRNAQDGISLIQTAEGALNETHSILQRMRELTVQASNDTNNTTDRGQIQKELNQLTDEIDRIANTTEFNTQKLLNGDHTGLKGEVRAKVDLQKNTSAAITATAAAPVSTGQAMSQVITLTRTAGVAGVAASTKETDFTAADANGGTVTLKAFAAGGTTLTVAGGDIVLSKLEDMKIGDSITISINAHEDAVTDAKKAFSFGIGANSGQTMMVGMDKMDATAIGIRNGVNAVSVADATHAGAAVTAVNNAIERVSTQRSQLGAYQNRLEHTINNLNTSSENLQASESRVRDVDMAKEMMNYSKQNILAQAAQAMLSQANQQPQQVLQLLR